MINNNIKLITFKILTLAIFCNLSLYAQILSEKEFNTYLRWNLNIDKNQFVITKKNPGEILLETLNIDLYHKLVDQLKLQNLPNKYIKEYEFDQNGFPQQPASIKIKFVTPNIEMFSFYKDGDKKLILDFWADESLNLVESKPVEVKTEPEKVVAKKTTPKKEEPKKEEHKIVEVKSEYRDFRYGGVFFWKYPALLPKIEEIVSLEDKTPIYFYPVKDRNYKKGEKEAHQQLVVNLFRKEKFGLMNKAIEIYHQKYNNTDDEVEMLFDYLKVNSLIKSNLGKNKDNKNIFKTAANLLENLIEKSTVPDFKIGLLKYTLQYYFSNKEYIKSLDLAKKLFVVARENIDLESAKTATQFIVHCLSELNQVEKLDKFIKDPGVDSLLSRQLHLAYMSYSLLVTEKEEDLIKLFELSEKSLKKPVQPEIIYNVAEAYFRVANYEKSLKLFQEFVNDYSYMKISSFARVRIGLINEISNDDERVALALYKDAVDRSSEVLASLEARIRLVSMKMNRKINITEDDKESLVFLEFEDREKALIEKDLKKLLWLVRERSFISQKDYAGALSYLSAIPLETMTVNDRKIFELDGAEIVYGLIKHNYENGKYSDVIKNWEAYKSVYIDKVALDPFINYVVCNSYLRLGLVKTFENLVSNLEKAMESQIRTFPIWIPREDFIKSDEIIPDLNIQKYLVTKDWAKAKEKVEEYSKINEKYFKKEYFLGILSFNLKDYKEAIKHIEDFIAVNSVHEKLNVAEVKEMFSAYVESIYNQSDMEKFKKTAEAVLIDIKGIEAKNKNLQIFNDLSERINYLLVEVLHGENSDKGEAFAFDFIKNFSKSMYLMRVKYLLGKSFANKTKRDEAKKIFDEILGDASSPEYLKELVKTELTSMELKKQSI